jgi:hypothetical protein
MATLWWHSGVRNVSEALSGLGELKSIISDKLKELGFSDVRVNGLEVAGGRDGCWLSIGHFHIVDRQYWEIVMCSGDTVEKTRGLVDEVVAMLEALRFL